MAWLVLTAIVVFIMVNWPREEPMLMEAVSRESTQTMEATATTEPGQKTEKIEVVAETLNFRSRPEYEDRTILKTLARGTVMVVKKRQEGWLFVELVTGQSGYVADKPDFLKKVD